MRAYYHPYQLVHEEPENCLKGCVFVAKSNYVGGMLAAPQVAPTNLVG